MTWLDDVIAVYGEPRLRWDDPDKAVRQRDDEGEYVKRAWVWFPGNRNHHISIKRYSRWESFAERTTYDYWVITVGAHRVEMPSVEWATRTEPDDDLMRMLLQATGFCGSRVARAGAS